MLRRAFRKRGHEAFSCDLLPARDESEFHIQADIVKVLRARKYGSWDLIILHPECQKVAVCGNRTWAGTEARQTQVAWVVALWRLAVLKAKKGVALENPASAIWPSLRAEGAVVQYIQPWQHGHLEKKKTGLALHGLTHLKPSKDVYEEMMLLPRHKRERIHFMSPGPDRTRDRSETFSGIATAMAKQWSK